MKREYDYSANSAYHFIKAAKDERDSMTEAERKADDEQASRMLRSFWENYDRQHKLADTTAYLFNIILYQKFLRTIQILRQSAEFNGDRMIFELRDDNSFGYIKYYSREILHVGDQVGDRTRHIWADVFSSFDGIAISVKGEELEIYIAESFMKKIQ